MQKISTIQQQWEQALEQVYRKALVDSDFRQQCLADGNLALQQVGGVAVHPDIRIRFVDAVQEIVFVVPRVEKQQDAEEWVDMSNVTGEWGFAPMIQLMPHIVQVAEEE